MWSQVILCCRQVNCSAINHYLKGVIDDVIFGLGSIGDSAFFLGSSPSFFFVKHKGLRTFELARFLRSRRAAPPLSVGWHRGLLTSPSDCFASRPRLSVQVLISQIQRTKKAVLTNGFFLRLVAGTGQEPAFSRNAYTLTLAASAP
mgnify:CR=1 FL=1